MCRFAGLILEFAGLTDRESRRESRSEKLQKSVGSAKRTTCLPKFIPHGLQKSDNNLIQRLRSHLSVLDLKYFKHPPRLLLTWDGSLADTVTSRLALLTVLEHAFWPTHGQILIVEH